MELKIIDPSIVETWEENFDKPLGLRYIGQYVLQKDFVGLWHVAGTLTDDPIPQELVAQRWTSPSEALKSIQQYVNFQQKE
jgi:hypothetical protein